VSWIQTYTGKRFDPLRPDPELIDIRDIAHSLSNQCRFTGHSQRFYSVAEHSIHVSNFCRPEDALYGLLHDASEAYLVDLPRPLKHDSDFGVGYRRVESRMQDAVAIAFGLSFAMPKSVKVADRNLLLTEKRDLLGPSPDLWYVGPGEEISGLDLTAEMYPRAAELIFLRRYYALSNAPIWEEVI
jgi:hypothetical protein